MAETMTVKQLAEMSGLTERSIQKKIRELYPQVVVSGKRTEMTAQQALHVLSEIRTKGIIQPRTKDAQPRIKDGLDVAAVIKATAEAVTESVTKAVVTALREERKALPHPENLPEPQSEYMSALGFANLTGLGTSTEYLRRLGKAAKRVCNEMGYEVRSMPDHKYGKVNLYPVDALEAAWRLV